MDGQPRHKGGKARSRRVFDGGLSTGCMRGTPHLRLGRGEVNPLAEENSRQQSHNPKNVEFLGGRQTVKQGRRTDPGHFRETIGA